MQIEILTKQDLQKFKEELLEEMKRLFGKERPVDSEWLRSAEVRQRLKISPGTLQNFRINGVLKYEKLGGIFYYAQADIDRLLGKMGNV